MDWKFYLLVTWAIFIGYCIGRAHECWIRFSQSIDNLQKLSTKIVNKE